MLPSSFVFVYTTPPTVIRKTSGLDISGFSYMFVGFLLFVFLIFVTVGLTTIFV